MLKGCCEGMPAAMTAEAGAERAVFITALQLLSYKADSSFSLVLSLTWLFWDLKASYFFISSIMFLFLSCLVESQFRQEEWLPRGPCSVTGRCMVYVVMAELCTLRWGVWVIQLRPLIQRRRDHISSWGWWEKSRHQELFVGFSSFTVGVVAG